ncbi:39S ribosomal protein l18 [Plakobranchus ocellatus]|uniref:Large ribosomal subunit protein uL18m n=1 Tax=Plakobranchus ocellatus TaxID=259542 RepID=A0AAV4AKV1_9GAST|nr:39S ribosomal protein l18 [Plakobranchus ocellatus]
MAKFLKLISSASQIEAIHTLSTQLKHVRCLSTSSVCLSTSDNSDYVISPVYHNRNPRNLEKLAYARKRLGWKFQSPRKDYYHKLVLQRSSRHTKAWVEHFTGKVVLSASTDESAISSQLNSLTDVSASENVGRVLAQRCLESGITEVFFDEDSDPAISERVKSFVEAFRALNISLTEPEMKIPEYRPGINYEGYNRYAEPKSWKEDYQDI